MTQKISKKAQAGTLATLIIVLASAIVIGALIYKINTELGGCRKNVEACRFSIVSAATSKRFKAGSPINELKCPRGELCDVILKKDDIVENGKINQDKAHKIIADAMAECWWMVGEGKIDPFSNWNKHNEKSLCLICKTIYFDEELVEWMAEKQSKLVSKILNINIENFKDDEQSLIDLTQKIESKKSQLTQAQINKFEKEYLQYVVASPVMYLKTEEKSNKETYWKYLYNEGAAKLTSQQEKELQKSIILPNTKILVRMYKTKSKSWLTVTWAAVKWPLAIVGSVIAAVLVALFIIPSAIIAVFSAIVSAFAHFATLILGSIVVKTLIVATIIIGLSVTTIVPAGLHAYDECEECNGIGGISLVQPDITPLKTETKVCLEKKGCPDEDDHEDVKICDIIVN